MNDVLPTPAEVMAFLDRAAGDLDRLGKELEHAHIELGDAEVVYLEEMDIRLVEMVEEYEAQGKRIPGEDIRQALARKRIDWEIVSHFRKAKRRVDGLNIHAKKLETAVSARQSTLRGMSQDVEGFGPKGPTYGRR